jgi:cytochrome c oxidase subunit III
MDIPYTVQPRPDTGVYNAKVGIWLFLASEVMLFGGLFSAYILLRVGSSPGFWPHGWLNVPLGTINTILLASSAVSALLGWASLKMKQFSRYKLYQGLTLVLAIVFLGIKGYEYRDKLHHYQIDLKDGRIADGHMIENTAGSDFVRIEGRFVQDPRELYDLRAEKTPPVEKEITIERSQILKMQNYGPWHNDYLAMYFTLTGLHALHILGGILVFAWLWGPGSAMWETDPERFTNRVEVSGLFWHFVDLVWIFLFPVLYLT